MAREMFVNLAVEDLARTAAFFDALGFAFDRRFTDDDAAAMIVGEGRYVMFLRRPFFETFTDVRVADASKTTEVLVALSAESRDEVDDLVTKATALGAVEAREHEDRDFMYSRSFHDLDGHVWEFVWMHPDAEPLAEPAADPDA